MDGTNLVGADLRNTRLRIAKMNGVVATRAVFVGATMTGTRMVGPISRAPT